MFFSQKYPKSITYKNYNIKPIAQRLSVLWHVSLFHDFSIRILIDIFFGYLLCWILVGEFIENIQHTKIDIPILKTYDYNYSNLVHCSCVAT